MQNKSLTIVGLIVMAILFIANQAGVALTEGELTDSIQVATKLFAVIAWVVIYVKRLIRGDTTILGSRK